MGWLHEFNLKRKVAGVLTKYRGIPQSAVLIAREANAEEREVEQLLDLMDQGGYVLRKRLGGSDAYQLNEAQQTVSKVLHTFEDKNEGVELGMTLRPDRNGGWTAELLEPAGLLVHGSTREEARERGRAMMQRMAALPSGPTLAPLSEGQR